MQLSMAALLRGFLVVVITAICFSPVIEGTFSHMDDDAYVFRNEHVREGLTLQNTVWALQSVEVSNWHPLTWLSYMLDVELFGMSAPHMHAVNLLLHLLNSLLLFTLIRRVLSLDAAFIAALVFAIHPLHVESVAWISQRKELLSFFFLMLSTHSYFSYQLKNQRGHYYGSIAAFTLALMSKPMAVSFPLLLILLDYWPLRCLPDLKDRTAIKQYMLEKLPFVILAAIGCVLALVAHSFAIDVVREYSLSDKIVLVAMAYTEYLKQFVFPLGLNFYYSLPELSVSVYFGFCFVLLLGLSWLSIQYARKFPMLFVAWWWYVIALLPVIGILKVGGQFVADRYTYLSFLGVIFALAYLVHQVKRDERFALLMGSAIVLFFCATISYEYARSWQHNISIARRGLAEDPENPFGYYILVKGVEVRLTQQLLDDLAQSNSCIEGRLDVFAGPSEQELACLQQAVANDPGSKMILAAQHFREFELEASAVLLADARAQASAENQSALTHFGAIQAVLEDDIEAIAQHIAELRALAPSEQRSAALFLSFYQLGNIEAANQFLNEVLEDFINDAS